MFRVPYSIFAQERIQKVAGTTRRAFREQRSNHRYVTDFVYIHLWESADVADGREGHSDALVAIMVFSVGTFG